MIFERHLRPGLRVVIPGRKKLRLTITSFARIDAPPHVPDAPIRAAYVPCGPDQATHAIGVDHKGRRVVVTVGRVLALGRHPP